MGSTSFLGFSYPNLLLVFLDLLFFRNLYHIFLYTLRRAALASSHTTTYHIQQLCPKRVGRKDTT